MQQIPAQRSSLNGIEGLIGKPKALVERVNFAWVKFARFYRRVLNGFQVARQISLSTHITILSQQP
jgi:hypothetical protein